MGRILIWNKSNLLVAVLLSLSACNTRGPLREDSLQPLTDKASSSPTEVQAIVLEKKDFPVETLSQGTVRAVSRADVTFPFEGRIEKIYIKRGQRVEAGALLAKLEDYDLNHECDLIRQEIAEARLRVETKLVSLGYKLADTAKISANLWNNIQVENGLPSLQLKLQKAEYQLNQADIRAPIPGVVANLEAQAGNPTANYEKLCTIIDDSKLEVEFHILEAEIAAIKPGNRVQIIPLYNTKQLYSATITGINPEVDASGMVLGFARIKGQTRQSLDGMKVKVHIQETIPGQLVLPKSAIVDRQNKFVTFAYKSGQAHWVYAQIVNENSTQYAIDDSGVQLGDTVIISNNFDLAHLEEVALDSLVEIE